MEEPKKKLKTIVSFSSEEVFDKALAEPNTSALVEVLLAQHYGLTLTGDSVQARTRQAVLDKIQPPEPVEDVLTVATASPQRTSFGPSDGLEHSAEATAAPEPTPSVETPAPEPEPSPAVPDPVVDPLADEDGLLDEQDELPDGSPESPAVPDAPVVPDSPAEPTALDTLAEVPFAPVYPADHPENPANTVPVAQFAAGDKVCPTCGKNFAPLPYCLNCL